MPERETTLANSALFLIHTHDLLYDCQRGANMGGDNNFLPEQDCEIAEESLFIDQQWRNRQNIC